jgi:hypothetical protein
MHELRVGSRAHLVAVTVTEEGGCPFEIQVKRAPVEVVWPGDGREPERLPPAQAEARRFAVEVADELRSWGDTQHDTRLAATTRNIERALAEGFDFRGVRARLPPSIPRSARPPSGMPSGHVAPRGAGGGQRVCRGRR